MISGWRGCEGKLRCTCTFRVVLFTITFGTLLEGSFQRGVWEVMFGDWHLGFVMGTELLRRQSLRWSCDVMFTLQRYICGRIRQSQVAVRGC